ncbi:AAA family ATPase [Desertihabitans aurantiacus]|uniref:AAA family ATPase n=1 Tax=Desertihabitans aurantiacus TaxID=2282477 RepID=UPI0018E51C04|nr:ATP-binding protein [Desertihabitans aurantiacus]
MDEQQRAFIETFRRFIDDVVRERVASRLTPLGQLVEEHLGTGLAELPVVSEPVPTHRLVDADIALEALAAADPQARLVGVDAGRGMASESVSELLSSTHTMVEPGAVDYTEVATGPDTQRQVVALGLRLFTFDSAPVAVLQAAAKPQYGMDSARLDVLAADPAVAGRLLAEVRRLMRERSVLRGQVVTFADHSYDGRPAGATFLARPRIAESEIVLPDGVLDRVVAHVVGIGAHRDALRAAGRHLKRGVLLYGPPGTGKTHTVRHLISRTEGTTVVLLTGPAIAQIGVATELARALQPAMVVLEDVDLIAQDRDQYGPQPLLFALLDALDGLEGDADVAFVMTTNRVELLERALAERPGRVDLAVPVDLPDAAARVRLFALYAEGLGLGADALAAAAARAEGVTASFAKELMRRVVLRAVERGAEPDDDDLAAALDQLLSGQEELTRSLLGGRPG